MINPSSLILTTSVRTEFKIVMPPPVLYNLYSEKQVPFWYIRIFINYLKNVSFIEHKKSFGWNWMEFYQQCFFWISWENYIRFWFPLLNTILIMTSVLLMELQKLYFNFMKYIFIHTYMGLIQSRKWKVCESLIFFVYLPP